MFRILVAEDDHAIRTLITTKLKQENYTIYTAENGEEALSVMEKHQPRPVTVLPVVDAAGVPVGIVHLTDLLRQGVV